VVEHYAVEKPEDEFTLLHVRHLQRFELGTSYPAIVATVAKLLKREPFPLNRPTLVVDGTGVGRGVVDLFRKESLAADLRPATITAGNSVTFEDGYTRVPKRDLVAAVQVGLQTDKLKIAASLPEAATLTTELQNFQVKITDAANDTYGAWREGSHDDLVLALAMAAWLAQSQGPAIGVVQW